MAHNPGLSDDQLEEIWEFGTTFASSCSRYKKGGASDNSQATCVDCETLSSCNGDQESVRPDLLQLVKKAFLHDSKDDDIFGDWG